MKFICIAGNYRKSTSQLDQWLKKDPIIFLKPATALLDKNQPFKYEDHFVNIVHELELVYKISKKGKHIAPENAHHHYSEVTVGIDLSDRGKVLQLREAGQP